jgi:hypothetical protein
MKKLILILTLFTINLQAQTKDQYESIYDKEIHEIFKISAEDLEYNGIAPKKFHKIINKNDLKTYTVFRKDRVSYVKVYSNDFEYTFTYDRYVKMYFLFKQ